MYVNLVIKINLILSILVGISRSGHDSIVSSLRSDDFEVVQSSQYVYHTHACFLAYITQPVDRNSRVALRYEVGRFFGGVARLKQAVDSKEIGDAESAFASMSVALDR